MSGADESFAQCEMYQEKIRAIRLWSHPKTHHKKSESIVYNKQCVHNRSAKKYGNYVDEKLTSSAEPRILVVAFPAVGRPVAQVLYGDARVVLRAFEGLVRVARLAVFMQTQNTHTNASMFHVQ